MIPKWIAFACVALSVAAYRMYYGEITIVEGAIVGAIGGGIGGSLGALFHHFFGKHESLIIDFVDNVLWFILFCIASAIVGSIISYAILPYFAHELLQHIVMFIVTLGLTVYLTARKVRSKRNKQETIET